MPQTVSVALNGTLENTHTYPLGAPLTTRTVIVNGSNFVTGQNTIVFTLVSGAGVGLWTVTISDVIVHFQRRA
jgi:hypothetical protein